MSTKESNAAAGEFELLKLASLSLSPFNPRKFIDERKQKELEESIRQVSIVEPIIVREVHKDGQNESVGYQIVCGERRYLAAKKIGLPLVPCIIRVYTDDEAMEVQIVENLQRSDIHPMNEAEGYSFMVKKLKQDIRTIASKVGKSPQYVANRLKLMELIEPAKKALWDGTLDIGKALVICRVPAEFQKELLESATDEYNSSTVEELEGDIEDNIMVQLSTAPWELEDPELVKKAGPCSLCPKRTGFNQDLFGNVGKKDKCLDTGCFAIKMKAYMEAEQKRLAQHGLPVRTLSENEYSSGDKGALLSKDYKRSSKKEADAYGILVDGKNIGESFPVKLIGKKPEKKAAVSAKNKALQEKQKKESLEGEAREAAEKEAFTLFLKKIKLLTFADLKNIAVRFAQSNEVDREIEDLIWRELKKKQPGWQAQAKIVSSLKEREIATLLLGILAGEYLSMGDEKEFESIMSRYKIDLKKLTKDHLAKLEVANAVKAKK